MGLRKDVKDIKEKLDNITSELFVKAKKYDEIMNYLSNIKISVKRASLTLSDDARYGVKVEYQVPDAIIKVDKDKNHTTDMFKSINMLNLISISDMEKITKKLEEAKQKNGE